MRHRNNPEDGYMVIDVDQWLAEAGSKHNLQKAAANCSYGSICKPNSQPENNA